MAAVGAIGRLAMCGVVGGAAALGVFAIAAPTASQSALLQVLSQQVTLSRDGAAEHVTVERVIRSGDTVRTDGSGRAVVTYPDGSTATLDGSSDLTIEFVRTSAGDYLVRMEQTIGRVWYAAARAIGSGGRYEVRSAAMASVIRAGSGFYVAVSEDGTTSITATSGTVDATAGGATVTLAAGASTTVSAPGQTPAPPQVVAADPQAVPQSPTMTQAPPLAAIGPADKREEQTKESSSPSSTESAPVADQPSQGAQPVEAPKTAPPTKPAPIPYIPTSLLPAEPADKVITEKVTTAEIVSTPEKVSAPEKLSAAEKVATSEKAAAHTSSEHDTTAKDRENGDGR